MLTTFHSKEVVLSERIKGFFLIKDVVFQNYSLLSNKQINNKISQIYDRNIFLLSLQDIQKLFNDEHFVKEIKQEDLIKCVRKGCLDFVFVPVLTGSAFKNKGVQPLLDAVVDYLPSPEDIGFIKGTKPG